VRSDSGRRAKCQVLSNAEQALKEKTMSFISLLQEDATIETALNVCDSLELATNVSSACCEYIAFSSAVSTLFRMIRSCSRSSPHQELLK
jgi:hypothetical protein